VSGTALPPGYVRSAPQGTVLVARDWACDALAQALSTHGTLHRWAESQAAREALRGRGVAWATTLSAGAGTQATTPVVVRHSRHGGMLAPVTGDLFLLPTRAPLELANAVRLAASGVATPEVIAYTAHPVAAALARSDVMTRRLPEGRDFPAAWSADRSPSARGALIDAVAALLRALSAAGAHHPDLNVKNVYVAGEGAAATAYVLDVDRVKFGGGAQAAARNFARLARSARKWNETQGLDIGDDALVRLASLAWVES
jgi:hypothetical protein